MKSFYQPFLLLLTALCALVPQGYAQKASDGNDLHHERHTESHIKRRVDSLRTLIPENDPKYDSLINALYTEYKAHYLNLGGQNKWAEALSIARSCEKIFIGELSPKITADLIYNIGYLYDKNERFREALDYYHRSAALYEEIQHEGGPDLRNDLALVYNNIGVVHAHTGFFTERKKNYLKAKAIWESMDEVDKSNLISLYGNLLRLFRQYGDKSAAEELIATINANFDRWISDDRFGRGRGKLETTKPKSFYYVEKHRLNLLYTDLTDNKQGGMAHLDSLRFYFNRMRFSDQKRYAAHLLTAINSAAAPLVDYDEPEERQLKKRYLALGLRESKRLGSRYNEMIFHTELVNFYLFSADDYGKALTHLDLALQIGKEMDIREFNLLNIYIKRGDILQQMGRFGEARDMTVQAFSLLLGESDIDLYAVQQEMFAERNDIFYVNALREVAKIYKNQYRKDGSREHARLAHHFYKIAADLFHQYYQKGVYNPWLDRTNTDINEGLLSMHLGLGQTEHGELINTIENNASQHLWKEFEAKYQQYSRVPDSLLLKRTGVLAKVRQNDTLQRSRQEELEAIQQQIHAIDSTYAPFFEFSFDIRELQRQLRPGQLLLKYTITNSGVYVFGIRPDTISVVALGKKDALLPRVEEYYEALKAVRGDYREASEELYRSLIAPIDLSGDIHTLIVIPENILGFVPFETLIDPNSGKPLVSDYQISYSHSLKLWQLQQQSIVSAKNKALLAVFSPRYSNQYLAAFRNANGPYRSRLQDIKGAAMEAEYVATMWKGDLYERASKQDFLENASRYQIYHFAMHALLDESDHRNSGLIFQEEEPLLYHELYGMHFPAELVVLSACNTGMGKLEKGEGLMSLSRALTYSGVRSSVYSLWQVPDKETAEIMMTFYAYLKKGHSKTEALTRAKREFLANNPMKSHPFFWAGFVINGHIGALPSSGFSYSGALLAAGVVLALLLLGMALWRKYPRSQAKKAGAPSTMM